MAHGSADVSCTWLLRPVCISSHYSAPYIVHMATHTVDTYVHTGSVVREKAETFGKLRLRPSAPKAEKPKPEAESRTSACRPPGDAFRKGHVDTWSCSRDEKDTNTRTTYNVQHGDEFHVNVFKCVYVFFLKERKRDIVKIKCLTNSSHNFFLIT